VIKQPVATEATGLLNRLVIAFWRACDDGWNTGTIKHSPLRVGPVQEIHLEDWMPKAIWNGAVLAEAASDQVEEVEGNIYFPTDAINREYLEESNTHTVCPWKGTASYFTVVVDGQENRDAAWYYPEPKPAAKQIAGRAAFWRGVRVEP
jgi:uncharacterized protein (DUF427 family)